MHRRIASALVALSGVLLGGTAQGAPIPLNLTKIFPDIALSQATIKYTASNSTLLLTASPQSFDIDGVNPIDHPAIATPKLLSLSMVVDQSNGTPVSGSLSITGKIAALGATSGTLLTGTINPVANFFGVLADNKTFEFRFVVTGGDLAPYYNGTSAFGAMIVAGKFVDAGSIAYTGVFTSDFRNASGTSLNGVADVFIPEPASLGVMAVSALTMLAGSRVRRAAR